MGRVGGFCFLQLLLFLLLFQAKMMLEEAQDHESGDGKYRESSRMLYHVLEECGVDCRVLRRLC